MRCSTLTIEAYPYLRALEEQAGGYESTGRAARREPWIRRTADSLARLATREVRESQSSRTPGPGGA